MTDYRQQAEQIVRSVTRGGWSFDKPLIDAITAALADAAQPLRAEIEQLSAAWIKAGEGWEHDPAGRTTLRHGEVLRDVLMRTMPLPASAPSGETER
jgi:hypothetical protein